MRLPFLFACAAMALTGCATYSNPETGPTANVRIGYPDVDVRSHSRALMSSGPSCSNMRAIKAKSFRGHEWDKRDADKLAAYKTEVFSLKMPRDENMPVGSSRWAELRAAADRPVSIQFEYSRKNGGGQQYLYCYPQLTMRFEKDKNYEVRLLVAPTDTGEKCMIFFQDLDLKTYVKAQDSCN